MDQTPEQASRDDEPGTGRGRSQLLFVVGGLVLIAVVALLAVFSGGDDTPIDTATNPINNLVFVNEDGTEGTLADFEGEPTVVNFFASWCAPCRAELPDFKEVHLTVSDDVQFVGISHDIDESSWRSLIAEFELSYPTAFQPEQEIWETLNLFGMPATAFITPDGEVVYTFSGALNSETLRELIAEHLDVEV